MEIIPTVNCGDFECVKRRIEAVKELGAGWAQIDVSEKDFCGFENWNEPERFAEEIGKENLNFYFEVHLMVKKPLEHARRWLEAGADRIIAHAESEFDFGEMLSLCREHGAELMMAILPETPAEKILPYLKETNLVQLLAVSAGPSGQEFKEEIFSKINSLLESSPGVIIEVDGGVDDKVIKKLQRSGVEMVAVGSYIFGSPNQEEKYKALLRAVS